MTSYQLPKEQNTGRRSRYAYRRVSNSSVTSRLCTLTLAEVSVFGAWFWRGSESLRAVEPQRLTGMLSNTRADPTYNILEAQIEPISVERIRATSHCQVFCCSPRYVWSIRFLLMSQWSFYKAQLKWSLHRSRLFVNILFNWNSGISVLFHATNPPLLPSVAKQGGFVANVSRSQNFPPAGGKISAKNLIFGCFRANGATKFFRPSAENFLLRNKGGLLRRGGLLRGIGLIANPEVTLAGSLFEVQWCVRRLFPVCNLL